MGDRAPARIPRQGLRYGRRAAQKPERSARPSLFRKLLARIRDIRSSGRVFYRKVLEICATSIRELLGGGWALGSAAGYDRERALYTEDSLAFVKQTQPKVWEKFITVNPDKAFLDRAQRPKAAEPASL